MKHTTLVYTHMYLHTHANTFILLFISGCSLKMHVDELLGNCVNQDTKKAVGIDAGW